MKRQYFSTQARRVLLRMYALEWLGTPWRPGSAVKGGGVDCVRLCSSVLTSCAALPPTFEIPTRRTSSRNVVEVVSLLDSLPWFERAERLAAGDLVVMTGDLHLHFALVVEDADGRFRFLQCLQGPGVFMSEPGDSSFASRILGIWRPVETD